MMTVEDCMRKAWASLLAGDTAGRDRWCRLAANLMAARERLEEGRSAVEGAVIALPDRSHERIN